MSLWPLSGFLSLHAGPISRGWSCQSQEWTIHTHPQSKCTSIQLALKDCQQVEVCRTLIPVSLIYGGAEEAWEMQPPSSETPPSGCSGIAKHNSWSAACVGRKGHQKLGELGRNRVLQG